MKDVIEFLLENKTEYTVTYRNGVPCIQVPKKDQSGAENLPQPVYHFMIGACESYTEYRNYNVYKFQP